MRANELLAYGLSLGVLVVAVWCALILALTF